MGWTDEEEVPAINITWDGNTEGKTSFDSVGTMFYKVSDDYLSIEDLVGCTIKASNDVELKITSAQSIGVVDDGKILAMGDFGIVVVNELSTLLPVEETGVYFMKNTDGVYLTSLTKEASTKETIHKIDSKYISNIVVRITQGANAKLIADKTFEEISVALPNVIVIAQINGGQLIYPLSGFTDSIIVFERLEINSDDNNIITEISHSFIYIGIDDSVSQTESTKTFD